MGLDMYLNKKIYIGANYEHRNVTGTVDIYIHNKKVNIELNKISYIIEDIAYWRKANQIHNWFVSNVQNNNDDCGEYRVTIDQLKELLETCGKVLDNKKLAKTLLPTVSGFFFGDTEYNPDYYSDLEYTIEQLDKVLNNHDENADYYYHSSW
jgi:hypothetical protein